MKIKKNIEKTLVIIKPDAIERKLVGSIIKRFEERNFNIERIAFFKAKLNILKKHYPDEISYRIGKSHQENGLTNELDFQSYGLKILKSGRKYMMRCKIYIIVIEGINAIKEVREMIGTTEPATAKIGTIRKDFGLDIRIEANNHIENLIHASDSAEAAEFEIKLWFPE